METMVVKESSGAQSVDHRCDVCFQANAPEFTAASRAHCPNLAPWLEFVCERCIGKFALKSQLSEARAAAKDGEKKGR